MSLATLDEIERAIDALPPQQMEDLYTRLERKVSLAFETRVASDLAAGRLNQAIFRALDDEANCRAALI